LSSQQLVQQVHESLQQLSAAMTGADPTTASSGSASANTRINRDNDFIRHLEKENRFALTGTPADLNSEVRQENGQIRSIAAALVTRTRRAVSRSRRRKRRRDDDRSGEADRGGRCHSSRFRVRVPATTGFGAQCQPARMARMAARVSSDGGCGRLRSRADAQHQDADE